MRLKKPPLVSVLDTSSWLRYWVAQWSGVELSNKGWELGISHNQVVAHEEYMQPQAKTIDVMLSIQGHPEFTVDYCHRLMFIRQARYAKGQYEYSVKSLEQPLHSDVLGRWIINFLHDDIHL